MTFPIARASATLLIAATMWAGIAGTAHAATEPDKKSDSEVSVSVPAATPSGGPSTPVYTPPPPPPASDGDGDDSGAGVGGSPVRSNGGGGGGAAPAVDTTAPTTTGCVPKEPVMPTAPKTGGGAASVDEEVYAAGDTVTAIAAGFGANEQVQLVLFSEPSLVGTFAADAAGAVTAQFAISAETLAGSHTLQFTGWCGSTSTVDVFVGAANSAATAGVQGVPPWMWWVGGVLALLLLVAGAWWIIRVMRAPAAPEAVLA